MTPFAVPSGLFDVEHRYLGARQASGWDCGLWLERLERRTPPRYVVMNMSKKLPDLTLPSLSCACATLRRADRAVTSVYDGELRDTGFRSTQFTLLQVLRLAGEVTLGQLAELLALDSTTLTRSLAPLIRRGFIAARPGQDRRERLLRLTEAGEQQLQCLMPHWERAQRKLRNQLGPGEWGILRALLDRLAGAMRT